MLVKCNYCEKEFEKRECDIKRTSNNFCDRSCSTTFRNLERTYKKIVRVCKYENWNKEPIPKKRYCGHCESTRFDITLKEAIYTHLHKSSAYSLVRGRARAIAKKQGWNSCMNCNYKLHIEIGHIIPIGDFTEDTRLSVINAITNLAPLCPNCHWEFDNGLLKLFPTIKKLDTL